MERGPRHKDENRKSKRQGRGEWQVPEAGRDGGKSGEQLIDLQTQQGFLMACMRVALALRN